MKDQELDIRSATSSRRAIVQAAGVGSLGLLAGPILAGCGGSGTGSKTASNDGAILGAAAVAEALATTMYYNIVAGAIYQDLNGNAPDQAYLVAGFEQELNHYNTLVGLGAASVATGTDFFFPSGMFTDRQTTVNTLVTLEDAFIAAYLIGVRDLSTTGAKVLAGQILGVESEHRTLARVIANDLGLSSSTGLSGSAELVTPPAHTVNNIAYERTFSAALPNIGAVVTALQPFLKGGAGFSNTAFPFAGPGAKLPAGITPVTLDATSP